MSDSTVELDLEVIAETDEAIMVRDGDGTQAWLPKSQIQQPEGYENCQCQTIEVPEWLAIKEGLV